MGRSDGDPGTLALNKWSKHTPYQDSLHTTRTKCSEYPFSDSKGLQRLTLQKLDVQ